MDMLQNKKRYKAVSIKKIITRCKPGTSAKDSFDAIGPFLSSESRSRRHIIFNSISTIASLIGRTDHIATTDQDFVAKTLKKHISPYDVLAIKENHNYQMCQNI